MNLDSLLDQSPVIVAVPGPNGAGKSAFYEAFLSDAALRYINPDEIAQELRIDPYDAARLASDLRTELFRKRESFVFETVFSDPVGDKVDFLKRVVLAGYTVVLCFIGLDSPATSDERVSMRVSQGGHDVPVGKLRARYPRSLRNLDRAIRELPLVLVYDNSDLRSSFRLLAQFRDGVAAWHTPCPPAWFAGYLGTE